MLIYEFLLALVLALIVTAIVLPSGRYRADGGRSAGLFFLPLLLLLIWAMGVWITPVGQPVAGVYWLGFVVPAVFLLLLLLALATPSEPARREGDVIPDNAGEEAIAGTVIAFGLFFWGLLIAAFIALIVNYVA